MATAPATRAKPKDDNAQHSGRLLLRLAPALHGELAQAAEREGMSLNAYITRVLSESLLEDEQAPAPNRFMRIAVIVDLVMVAIATATVVVLLIAAWP
jgi:hypothetical protein